MKLADITVQNTVAAAIQNISKYRGIGSCGALVSSMHLLSDEGVPIDMPYQVRRAYQVHCKAMANVSGFFDIPRDKWLWMSKAEKEAIRLERLYYFWMANQDNMDAFS